MEQDIKKLSSLCGWFISLQVVTLIAFMVGAAFLYASFQSMNNSVANHLINFNDTVASIANPTTFGMGEIPYIEDWEKVIRDHNPIFGNQDAEIVVVEFTDFQCPYCRQFNINTRNQLIAKYGSNLLIIIKHFPLEISHPEAKAAAAASQCAHREDKFWEIKDLFFDNPANLSTEFLINAGKDFQLGGKYQECIQNQLSVAEVQQDIDDGKFIGVQGTPTFLINGKLVMGAIDMAGFDMLIENMNLIQ